jgi:hypothetical protein
MTSARYQGINARMDSVQKTLPEYVKKAGWNVKKVISFPNSVMFELKRGFFDKATINVKQIAQDVTLDVEGPRELMDIAETALTDSCDNPATLVGWKEQEAKRAQEAMSSAAAAQSQAQAAPVQVAQPAAPKPPAPKLEACLHCNAPLTYDPEEVLVICSYCGYINNPTGEQPPRYSMLPVDVNGTESLKIAQDHVGKGILVTRGMAERADWGAIILRYIPIWNVPTQLEGNVEGRRGLVKTKGTKGKVAQDIALNALATGLGGIFGGGKVNASDRVESVSVSELMDISVVARKAPEYQPDVGTCKFPLNKKEAFRKTGEETLNVEISAKEATERAKPLALEEVKSRYTAIRKFNVTARPAGEPELIYSPWWFIEYNMGGKAYSVIVDACSGCVVAGQRPWIPKGAKWR